jgi:hypothetical protein
MDWAFYVVLLGALIAIAAAGLLLVRRLFAGS